MLPDRWRGVWTAWRNKRLSDPRFQQWAADFPLTRSIARRRAGRLFDLVAGFVYSQTLAICVETGLLDSLSSGPRTSLWLAEATNLPVESMDLLLGAAAALDLVEPIGHGRFTLGSQGAAFLGSAGLSMMVEHHRHFYADLAEGAGLLRTGGKGELASYWPYATEPAPDIVTPGSVSAYSALMAATLPSVAADLLRAYPFRRHRKLLDVGGGNGAFLREISAHAPDLELMLFDLPAVIEQARDAFCRAGTPDRVSLIAGDFLRGPLPPGADLVTLIRIVHDHDDAGTMALFRSVRACLPDDGALVIAEPMSMAPKRDRVADVYFALYLHAMGRGRARTPAEISDFLRAAGFRRTRELTTRSPFLLRVVVAEP